jgi:general secretion pathway protein B
MSFILDALKKSENDRQRQSGPALFEVRVPPPRSKFPLLAVSIVSLLLVNLGVVAWLMLREPADAAESASQVAAASQAPASAPSASTAQATPPPGVPPAAQTQPGYPPAAGYTSVPPNGPPPSYGAAPGAAPGSYAQQAPGGYPPPPGAPPAGQGGYAPSVAPEPYLADEPPAPADLNPDDFEPAQEPTPGQFSRGRASRGTESGLPTYEEAATRTTLPPLHLDLHSYAADPSKRFVLINMKRLYEGQTMPEGVKVENITPDSAIMSFNGTKFVLDRD